MSMSMESISSSDMLSNNTGGPIIVSIAKVGIVFGIFVGAMMILESYLGKAQSASFTNYANDCETSDPVLRDRVTTPSTPVALPEEVHVALQIVSEEIVLEKQEEEEPTPTYVIGAEDAVDHINRMIGY